GRQRVVVLQAAKLALDGGAAHGKACATRRSCATDSPPRWISWIPTTTMTWCRSPRRSVYRPLKTGQPGKAGHFIRTILNGSASTAPSTPPAARPRDDGLDGSAGVVWRG